MHLRLTCELTLASEGRHSEDLSAWLSNLRLSKFSQGFHDLGVYELSDLAYVQPGDLDDIGMKRIPRRKFLKAQASLVAKWSDSDPASMPAAMPYLPREAPATLPSAVKPRQTQAKIVDKNKSYRRKPRKKKKKKKKGKRPHPFDRDEFLRKNPSMAGLEESLRKDLMSSQSVDSLIDMMEQMNADSDVPASGRSKGINMVSQLKGMLKMAKSAGMDLSSMSLSEIENMHGGSSGVHSHTGKNDGATSPAQQLESGRHRATKKKKSRTAEKGGMNQNAPKSRVVIQGEQSEPVEDSTGENIIQMSLDTTSEVESLREDLNANGISLVDNFLATAPPKMGKMYADMFGKSRLEEILTHAMVSAVLPAPEDSGGKIVTPLSVPLRMIATEGKGRETGDEVGQAHRAALASLASDAAEQLRQEGYVVIDRAFGAATAAAALAEARQLHRDGHMRPALTQDPRWKSSLGSETDRGIGSAG
eukprot:g4104.t1